MWAVSFFFINLVLAVAIVILWGSDTTGKILKYLDMNLILRAANCIHLDAITDF